MTKKKTTRSISAEHQVGVGDKGKCQGCGDRRVNAAWSAKCLKCVMLTYPEDHQQRAEIKKDIAKLEKSK